MADVTTTSPGSTTSSTLSAWAGPYVTDMLGKGQALSTMPYAQYGGAMTAGPSAIQSQAFQGVAGLTLPSATTNFGANTFSTNLPGTSTQNPYGVGDVQSYMNPYLQGVLDPQVRELRRQADISRIADNARLSKQGAFGGSRTAILEAENQRNLMQQIGDVTGKGYANAFDQAQAQQYKNAQLGMDAQKASEQSRQFGANLGLDQGKFGIAALDEQLKAGGQQRDITQQGLTADYEEFARQRDYPQQQVKFQQSLLQGLPISTVQNTPNPVSGFQNAVGTLAGVASIWDSLKSLGLG